jgi:hypothetical protein
MQILLHQIHQVVIKKFHRRYSLLEHTRICKWVQQEAMFSVASPSLTRELFTIGIYSGHLLLPSKLSLKCVSFLWCCRGECSWFCSASFLRAKEKEQMGIVFFLIWALMHLCNIIVFLRSNPFQRNFLPTVLQYIIQIMILFLATKGRRACKTLPSVNLSVTKQSH